MTLYLNHEMKCIGIINLLGQKFLLFMKKMFDCDKDVQ